MAYINAPEARQRYKQVVESILAVVDKNTAKKLTPLFEELILVRRSVAYHDRMRDKLRSLRAGDSQKPELNKPQTSPIEGPKYVYSPPTWANHFSSCPESLREEIREHTTKDVFRCIEYYWKDKSTGRIILKDINGLDLSTSE